MSDHKTTALVTGASAGLGVEFCRQLAERSEVIIAVARRADRLDELAGELADLAEVHRIEADLLTVEGVTATMEALRQKGPVDYLVNNAGFATMGDFADLPVDGQRDMVSLHIDATVTLCRAAVPFMRELGGGYIVNVSSLGAFMPAKGIAVYGATKAFLNYFSEALQRELEGTGVRVQALCPGYIRTEFHDAMVDRGFDRERIPAEFWSEPPEVVACSLAALDSGEVIVIPGEGNRALGRAAVEARLAGFD